MGLLTSVSPSYKQSPATMVSLVLTLLLPFMALAAPGSQDRGLLGDLITSPLDFAGCLSKCPISPLEFPGCSVDCAKETNSGDNRGLVADFAACAVTCKLNPDGTCDASPLGLPKPCAMINLVTG